MKIFGYDIRLSRSLDSYYKDYKKAFIKTDEARKRYYEAADKGRRGKSFRTARPTGANTEISTALPALRDRSRKMVRDNGWAKRAVEAVVKHTIGEGIRPAPLGSSIEINKRIKVLWKNWAETTACDFYGKSNFYGLQEQMMRSIVEGGDAIIILRRTQQNTGIPIKLQLCEGDLIDHSINYANDMGIARLGIQYSKEGELLGYWLYDSHPGETGFFSISANTSSFHSKEDVLHVFEVLRIGQARGVPFGVAGFMRLSDFGDYEDAQLFKQKMAANFCAFVSGAETAPAAEFTEDGRTINRMNSLAPGVIEYLGLGETVEFPNPPTVGDYDNYSTRILQGVAASFGITYEMLTMDYSRVNFTSGRMAKIDVTANFKSWQYNMIQPQLCAPVWDWFMNACIMTGAMTEYVSCDWTAPRVQQLDPVKETNAIVLQIQSGLTTWSETVREQGRDPQEFLEEVKQEREMLLDAGINFTSIVLSPDEKDDNDSTIQKNSNVVELNKQIK